MKKYIILTTLLGILTACGSPNHAEKIRQIPPTHNDSNLENAQDIPL